MSTAEGVQPAASGVTAMGSSPSALPVEYINSGRQSGVHTAASHYIAQCVRLKQGMCQM